MYHEYFIDSNFGAVSKGIAVFPIPIKVGDDGRCITRLDDVRVSTDALVDFSSELEHAGVDTVIIIRHLIVDSDYNGFMSSVQKLYKQTDTNAKSDAIKSEYGNFVFLWTEAQVNQTFSEALDAKYTSLLGKLASEYFMDDVPIIVSLVGCDLVKANNDLLGVYVQDQFYVQTINDCLGLRLPFQTGSSSDKDLLLSNVAIKANCFAHEETSCFHWKGGNFIVSGDLMFIGWNELAELQGNQRLRSPISAKLGLELGNDKHSITEAIGKITKKKVIWVGTEDRRKTRRSAKEGHQPIYHIDLFIVPYFQQLADGQNILNVVVGWPVAAKHNFSHPKQESLAVELQEWVKDTIEHVKSQLESPINGIAVEIHYVDLPVYFSSQQADDQEIQGYMPFLNGYIQKHEKSLSFLHSKPNASEYADEYKVFLEQMTKIGIEVEGKGVRFNYEQSDGLHCRFLALERN